MKITRRKADKFTGILIDKDAWNNPERPEYACSYCSRLLVRLADRNNQSESWFCRNCQTSYEPSKTEIRKRSKLTTKRGEIIEPDICSIGGTPDISLKKPVELKGGFAQLAKKGTIRITHYEEHNPK
jgi:hypothetical protein